MNLKKFISQYPPFLILIVCSTFLWANSKLEDKSDNALKVKVTFRLEGKTLKGKPKVVSAENSWQALYEKPTGTSVDLEETEQNIWMGCCIEGREYVVGWIVGKNKLFGYCSKPFIAAKDLEVIFSPGMPATIEYNLANPPKGVKATPAEVLLLREITINGKRTFGSNMSKKINRPGILRITGLAAGRYMISARTSDEEKYLNSRTPVLYPEDREVEIMPGSVNRFEPNYPEIDTTIEKGDVTIRGTLYGSDKKPLANKVVHLTPMGKSGFELSLYYPASKTDSKGRFEFFGVRRNISAQLSYDKTYVFLGKESMTEGSFVSVDIVVGLKALALEVRKPVKNLIIDWKEGGSGKLSDLAGKTIIVDVWATWCAPCIRALPDFNKLAEEFAKNSNVVFIALNIGYVRDTWEEMVDKAGWKSLRHGWLDTKKNPFYIDKTIPYWMIIDKDGVIRADGSGLDIKVIRQELDKVTGISIQ
jgi:thiol-disulfide isomerase/thioredoxin